MSDIIENVAACTICANQEVCPYPRSLKVRDVKSALENEVSLKTLAVHAHDAAHLGELRRTAQEQPLCPMNKASNSDLNLALKAKTSPNWSTFTETEES